MEINKSKVLIDSKFQTCILRYTGTNLFSSFKIMLRVQQSYFNELTKKTCQKNLVLVAIKHSSANEIHCYYVCESDLVAWKCCKGNVSVIFLSLFHNI